MSSVLISSIFLALPVIVLLPEFQRDSLLFFHLPLLCFKFSGGGGRVGKLSLFSLASLAKALLRASLALGESVTSP